MSGHGFHVCADCDVRRCITHSPSDICDVCVIYASCQVAGLIVSAVKLWQTENLSSNMLVFREKEKTIKGIKNNFLIYITNLTCLNRWKIHQTSANCQSIFRTMLLIQLFKEHPIFVYPSTQNELEHFLGGKETWGDKKNIKFLWNIGKNTKIGENWWEIFLFIGEN